MASFPEDLVWSTDAYRDNFNRVYYEHIGSKDSRSRVCMKTIGASRVLHIEACYFSNSGLFVCLRDVSLSWDDTERKPLNDNAICLCFGGSNLVEHHVESSWEGDEPRVVVSFLLQNGEIYKLELRAIDRSSSVIAPLIIASEGNIVNLNHLASSSLRTAICPWASSYCTTIKTFPLDREILSAAWLSLSSVLIGFSKGELLMVNIKDDGLLSETPLRKETGLQAAWSGWLGGTEATDGDDIIAAAASAGLDVGLVMSRLGVVRMWRLAYNECIQEVNIMSELFRVSFDQNTHRASSFSRPSVEHSKKASPKIKASMIRTATIPVNAAGVSIIVVALAVEMDVYGEEERLFLGGKDSSKAHNTFWQILVGTYVVDARSGGKEGGKLHILSGPVTFPDLLEDERGSAMLVEMDWNLSLGGEAGPSLSLYSIWRAKDSERNGSRSSVRVGQTTLPVTAQLHTQRLDLASREHTTFSVTDWRELKGGTCLSRSETMNMEDEAACSGCSSSSSGSSSSSSGSSSGGVSTPLQESAQSVKVAMLKRIFLPRRFSRTVLVNAYKRFQSRIQQMAAQTSMAVDVPGDEDLGLEHVDHRWYHSPVPVLARSVAQVCVQLAQLTMVAQSGGSETSAYVAVLRDSFQKFIRQCEAAAIQSSNVLTLGCLLMMDKTGGGSDEFGRVLDSCLVAQKDGCVLALSSRIDTDRGARAAKQPGGPGQLWNSLQSNFPMPRNARQDLFSLQATLREKLRGDDNPFEAMFQASNQAFAGIARQHFNSQEVVAQVLGAASPDLSDFRAFMDEVLALGSFSHFRDGDVTRVGNRHAPCKNLKDKYSLYPGIRNRLHITIEVMSSLVAADLSQVQTLLLFLFVLLDAAEHGGCDAFLDGEALSLIADVYIPRTLLSFVYLGILSWMDSIYPTDNYHLTKQHNSESLFNAPPSDLASGTSQMRRRVRDGESLGLRRHDKLHDVIPDETLSVLHNLVLCSPFDYLSGEGGVVESMASRMKYELRPSISTSFANYAFAMGQYLCLNRWSTFLQYCSLVSAAMPPPVWQAQSLYSPQFTGFCLLFFRHRTLAVKHMSDFYEQLRKQAEPAASRDPRSETLQVINTTRRLLGVGRDVNKELWSSVSDAEMYSQYITSAANSVVSANENLGDALRIRFAVYFQKHQDQWESRRSGSSDNAIFEDGLGAFVDALAESADKPLLQIACRGLALLPEEDCVDAIHDYCQSHFILLTHVLNIYYVVDAVEMVERSRSVFPRELGIDLAIIACTELVDVIQSAIDVFQDAPANEASAAASHDTLVALLDELHAAWSRLFEYYLLHGDRYEQALESVMRLAQLDTALVPSASTGQGRRRGGITWNIRLRALVSQACDCGHLEWLCRMQDRRVGSTHIHLLDAVSSELASLVSTYDMSNVLGKAQGESRGSARNGANYFECSFAFHMLHCKFRDAAQVFRSLSERSSVLYELPNGTGTRHDVGEVIAFQNRVIATTILCLGLIPTPESFVLNDDAGFSSSPNKRKRTEAGSPDVSVMDQQQLSAIYIFKSAIEKAVRTMGTQAYAVREILALKEAAGEQAVVAKHVSDAGLTNTALSLATQSLALNNYSSSGAVGEKQTDSLKAILHTYIEELSRKCVAPPESVETSDFIFYSDAFVFSPFALAVPSKFTIADDLSSLTPLVRYDQLLDAVATLDSPAWNFQLHKQALNAMLVERRAHAFPATLIDSYVLSRSGHGRSADTVIAFGNFVSLVRLYIRHGKVCDACQLSRRLVRHCNARIAAAHALGKQADLFVPYSVLDQVIEACERRLGRSQAMSAPAAEDATLQQHVSSLRDTLETHFRLRLSSEVR